MGQRPEEPPILDNVEEATELTIWAIRQELRSAREKFPGANKNFAALAEEHGELAKALLDESNTRVWEEAVQVAVMAIRVATEGDPTLGR